MEYICKMCGHNEVPDQRVWCETCHSAWEWERTFQLRTTLQSHRVEVSRFADICVDGDISTAGVTIKLYSRSRFAGDEHNYPRICIELNHQTGRVMLLVYNHKNDDSGTVVWEEPEAVFDGTKAEAQQQSKPSE